MKTRFMMSLRGLILYMYRQFRNYKFEIFTKSLVKNYWSCRYCWLNNIYENIN